MLYYSKNRTRKYIVGGPMNEAAADAQGFKASGSNALYGDAIGYSLDNIKAAKTFNSSNSGSVVGADKPANPGGYVSADGYKTYGEENYVPNKTAVASTDDTYTADTAIQDKKGTNQSNTEKTKDAKNEDFINKNSEKLSGNGTIGGLVTSVGGIVADGAEKVIVDSANDGRSYVLTKKEKWANVGGAFVKGAAMGAITGALVGGGIFSVPMAAVGAILGGIGGVISGLFKNRRAKKDAEAALKAKGNDDYTNTSKLALNDMMSRSKNNKTVTSANATEKVDYTKSGFVLSTHFGGILSIHASVSIKTLARERKIEFFRSGGQLAETLNIIPKGVLHEEENELGDKGMPIVQCNAEKSVCEKKFEIEKDELILTLKNTKEAEALASGGKMEELGNFLTDQLLDNTHSFTEKFTYLNN